LQIMRKTIRRIIFIIAVLTLIFSSYKVIDYYLQEKESRDVVSSLVSEPENSSDGLLHVDINAVIATYPDVVCWLYQPGTNINYPVVQSADNEYYLRRLINGEHNMNGTLFMDYRNAADFSDYVTMIYGHNMKNGEMFSTFPNYAQQAYYDAHPEMHLYTPGGNYNIRLISGFLTDDTDEIYSFAEDSLGAEQIYQTALAKSAFKSNSGAYNGERLVILSTCYYEKHNSRFVLVGILEDLPEIP